jgi:hypothetical protein
MSVRRSQIPAPLLQTAAHGPTAASTNPDRQYNRRARRLLARYRKEVPPHVREYLLKSHARETAVRQGLQFAPSEYVHDFLSALEKFTPRILAGSLPGYGSLRACFGLDLVLSIAPAVEALEQQRGASRDARRTHSRAVSLTDTQRLDAQVALASVLGDDLHATSPRSRTATARIKAAEDLALEAARAREEVPVELLEDAGLSSEALATFEDTTRKADEAAGNRTEMESAAQTARAQLAEPCGRILRELRVLLQVARHARKKDPTTPKFSTRLVKHKKSTPPTGEDTAPATPTPTPAEPVTKPA